MAEPGVREDPFGMLGLPAQPGLTDEDVRAAWRRIAAATHPDREDGGNPAVYGAAAAAYVTLRTSFGRGEALADLGGGPSAASAPSGRRPGRHRGRRVQLRRRRDLVVRVVVAGAAGGIAFIAAGWSPGTVGVLAGSLNWLLIAALRR